ncbi:MAG: trypsin-like peptidase domain-containing protein [Gemmataceae bacterium]
MRFLPSWAAAMLAGLVLVSAGAATDKTTPFPRRNAVTEAVAKTKPAVVVVRVPRAGGGKDGIGSGVIIDERGYIVTNRHVIGAARKVKIDLCDDTTLAGDVVIAEAAYDLAVIRVHSEKPLKALPLAPTNDLLFGEKVIAIGHPYGYRYTVTSGEISFVGREIEMPTGDVLTGLIQHTAAINPGNSGGPLLNINGELIGINVALRDGSQSIAFAIQADTVKKLLSRRLSAASVAGVDLGLVCKEEVVGETGDRQKVVVERCKPSMASPVSRGDRIIAVGTVGVANTFDIERALWDRRPGEEVDLHVVRDGKEMTVRLTLRPGSGATPAIETTRR